MRYSSCKVIAGMILSIMVLAGCGGDKSASQLKNVFGADDRKEITTTKYPWNAIGKLSVGCTGTLVGKDLVVTAAHCVIDAATKRLRSDLGVFYPNYINGSYKDSSTITWVAWGTNDPPTYRGSDWAILRLKQPLGSKYGFLGIEPTNANTFPDKLTVAGYSTDFHGGEIAGVHHNCNVKARDAKIGWIFHDCDTARGSSGGPVLRMYKNALTIYGINVAELRDGSDSSLHLGGYDASHANVAIPSEGFLKEVKLLQNQ